MLYVFHGTDTYKVADQANRLVGSLRTKRPDATVYVFEGADFEMSELDELVEAQGLFVQKHIVVLKTPFETVEGRDQVLERLPRFACSQNVFVLSEGKVLAEQKRAFLKHAEKVEEHTKASQEKRGFDPFGVVAALKVRNRRALWEACMRAQRANESGEALCGLMHWAVRDMLQNAIRYARHYTQEELVAMSRALIRLYHDAHRGKAEIGPALERWTLRI